MPVAFADLSLSRRLERAEGIAGSRFVEARRGLAPETCAEWTDINGTYAMFDGPDSPVTQTFGLGLFSHTHEADLDRIEAFFRERHAPVCHEVSPLAGVELAALLGRRGYRPIEFTSVMYQPLGTAPFSAAACITARPMHPDERNIWSRIFVEGWGEHPDLTDALADYGNLVAATEGVIAFFAFLDGEPVATAVLRCDGGVALFAGGATIPKARRQGAQRALIAARMEFALEQGCDLAMMCAAPGTSSQHNAERNGFRIAYTRTKWRLA